MGIAVLTDERAMVALPVHLITVGCGHPQEPRKRPNGAEFHHILFVEKGEGMFEVGEQGVPLSEGTAVFIRKNVPSYYYKIGETFQTAWVTFDGAQMDAILAYFHAKEFSYLQNETLRAMIQAVYQLAKRNASPAILSKHAYDVLVTYFSLLEQEQRQPALRLAKQYIEAHFAQDLSVADIAVAAGISESLLFRLFHNEEHSTPVDYLRRIRIRNAEQMLLVYRDRKISEVGAACGFSDAAYFCKVFKAETGMPPGVYRTRYAF